MTNPITRPEIADAGRIRLGAAMRIRVARVPANVSDSGRVRLGAAMRLPTLRR